MVKSEVYYPELSRNFFVTLIFFLILFTPEKTAADRTTQPFSFYKKHDITLSLSSGAHFILNSSEFFEKYREISGGNVNYFRVQPDINAALGFNISKKFKLNFSINYFQANFEEYFVSDIAPGISSDINENFEIKSIPFITNLEYIPTNGQFRTFVGLGAGLSYNKISWQENIPANNPDLLRTGGRLYDKETLLPVLRISSGLELGFDHALAGNIYWGVIFTSSYTHIFRYPEIFSGIGKQLYQAPDYIDDNIELIPGSLSLNLGFYLNFN